MDCALLASRVYGGRVDDDGRCTLRHREAEGSAAEEHALDGRPLVEEPHVAAKASRDASGDREPDARAPERTRRRSVDLVERLEDALGAILRDPAPRVGDDELERGLAGPHHDADDAALGGELR